MEPQVAFYRLSRKVVNKHEEIPEAARQVMYYSLAIGHHVGVMDCFSELMVVPANEYARCVARLPDGPGRRKLEGVFTWDEIEINRSHAEELLPLLRAILPGAGGPGQKWIESTVQCLQEMMAEPAFYLMLKVRR